MVGPISRYDAADSATTIRSAAIGIATENQGFISNAATVVTSDGLVIVDALGSPSLAERFRGLLREVTDKRVVKVILTHYHADHIYGLQVFKDLGVEIVAPGGFQDYLDSPAAADRLVERQDATHRRNAYGVYLSLEQESLAGE